MKKPGGSIKIQLSKQNGKILFLFFVLLAF